MSFLPIFSRWKRDNMANGWKLVTQVWVMTLLVMNITEIPGQVLSPTRSTDWSKAGMSSEVIYPGMEVNILDFGADPEGLVSSSPAFAAAQAFLQGPGILYIPPGTYRFTQPILLQDSQVVRGSGAAATELIFNLGGTGDLIEMVGSRINTPDTLMASAEIGDSFVVVSDPNQYQTGDLLKLYKDDQDLVNDSWAYNTVAQILRIVGKSADSLLLDQVLRTDFPLLRNPAVNKLVPKSHAGVECLKITRLDATTGQSKNIYIKYAIDCWVKGVESSFCNFGHVTIESSSHIEVSGSYFHDAFNYGGGGKAYGIVLQSSANLCLLEDNILKHLRHSILLQSGANANVIAFNYSFDPFWDNFPNNSAGDLVCHGNYPFLNLFEHNIVQNLVIDNSHGANGPFNTFFRNRAELYGIIMTATNSPSQNFIGNEITNNGLFLGNYNLMGVDHFEFGNNHLGTITPPGTGNLPDTSYFYMNQPDFLYGPWSLIGPPEVLNTTSIPARDRFLSSGMQTVCSQTPAWVVWTNGAGTINWNDPLNWHSNSVPTTEDNVFIPASPTEGTMFPIVNVNTTINQIYIASGGRVETAPGVELFVQAE
ncbi:MAG: hypothetical protein HKN76_19695 [Saprospiraceae bacterium]|nr:hypothetical protein [Saprospiraceae bacterium]